MWGVVSKYVLTEHPNEAELESNIFIPSSFQLTQLYHPMGHLMTPLGRYLNGYISLTHSGMQS